MFNRLFGKGISKSTSSSMRDAVDSRGLEVTEDDPDTAWSRWEEAQAAQDAWALVHSPISAPLPLIHDLLPPSAIDDVPTQPLGLEDLTLEQRKTRALVIIQEHHPRVANTIRTLWGYRECSIYINKLVMDGDDGRGHARVGFNQDAVQAMLALIDVHDAVYGTFDAKMPTGFADPSIRAGWDGSR
jgi:hypothetical protein